MLVLSDIIKWIVIPQGNDELLQAQRLFHGRGHAYQGLEHLVIDWLPPVVLITLYQPESLKKIEQLADYLVSLIPPCRSIQLQHRYQSAGPIDLICGEPIKKLIVLEETRQFHISLDRTRNTGLFLDMRNGRDWLQQHSKDKQVLNLFAYTCGFSVAAIKGGATSVVNIDMSSAALSVGRENHRLNNQDLKRVRFEKLNILKSFGRLKKRGLFDTLVCDPPTFQKGSIQIERDYPKIMKRLRDFMKADSTLLLCLNSPDLNTDYLIENMKLYAPQYSFKTSIKAPSVYKDIQKKGLKTLVFNSV